MLALEDVLPVISHLFVKSQAGLPGVAQKAWGVLILSLSLLRIPYLNTTFPLTAKRKAATSAVLVVYSLPAPLPILLHDPPLG